MAIKKLRVASKVEETESGILAVKTEVQTKEPFYVKEEGKNCLVVNGNGEVQRVYNYGECADPKAAAESYAKKLSSQWHN